MTETLQAALTFAKQHPILSFSLLTALYLASRGRKMEIFGAINVEQPKFDVRSASKGGSPPDSC